MAEWIVIIEMVIKFIAECRENRTREQIRGGLLHPGAAETRAMRKILRGQGFRGRNLRAMMGEGFEELKCMGPAGIDDMLDEAEEDQPA